MVEEKRELYAAHARPGDPLAPNLRFGTTGGPDCLAPAHAPVSPCSPYSQRVPVGPKYLLIRYMTGPSKPTPVQPSKRRYDRRPRDRDGSLLTDVLGVGPTWGRPPGLKM